VILLETSGRGDDYPVKPRAFAAPALRSRAGMSSQVHSANRQRLSVIGDVGRATLFMTPEQGDGPDGTSDRRLTLPSLILSRVTPADLFPWCSLDLSPFDPFVRAGLRDGNRWDTRPRSHDGVVVTRGG
jgi:hypothetical protein